jgi:hypothetical protein
LRGICRFAFEGNLGEIYGVFEGPRFHGPTLKPRPTLASKFFFLTKKRDYQDKKINFNTLISNLSEMSNTDAILTNRKDSTTSANHACPTSNPQQNPYKGQGTSDEDIKRAIEESRTWLASNFHTYDFINFLSEQLGNGDLRLMSIIEKHVDGGCSGNLGLMQKFDNFCFKTLQHYL